MISDYLMLTGLNILLAWSVYVILLSGSLSFANGGFMGIGCYAAGVVTVKLGWPLLLALPVAGLAAGLLGAVVGLPALRTRGVYLILVTIGITACVKVTIESIPYLGGVQGFGGMGGSALWQVWGLVALVGAALFALSRTPLQRILDAIREDETVARCLGANVVYLKVAMFGIGAALAAVAGGLYGHYYVFVTPDHFNILVSIYLVLYVILGGVNNPWGPALGATAMSLLPEASRVLQDWRPTVFGVLILGLLLVRPQGLLPFRLRTARPPRPRP
ncbi:MAG TPA: branched-chain amino acid ABC transporter permease [Stellaceae bacterium]|nr:branched-chain amino acid ABC transporter permease [Stellaceae bacterium]